MTADDLSGQWTGIFNYPRGLPPTGFTATLRDMGGVLTGETAEPRHDGGATLTAMIDGTRTGLAVTFVKIYDALDGEHDSVRYEGTVDAGGQEITGRWDIPGVWSGTFIMVRDAGVAAADEREAEAEAEVPAAAPAVIDGP